MRQRHMRLSLEMVCATQFGLASIITCRQRKGISPAVPGPQGRLLNGWNRKFGKSAKPRAEEG